MLGVEGLGTACRVEGLGLGLGSFELRPCGFLSDTGFRASIGLKIV